MQTKRGKTKISKGKGAASEGVVVKSWRNSICLCAYLISINKCLPLPFVYLCVSKAIEKKKASQFSTHIQCVCLSQGSLPIPVGCFLPTCDRHLYLLGYIKVDSTQHAPIKSPMDIHHEGEYYNGTIIKSLMDIHHKGESYTGTIIYISFKAFCFIPYYIYIPLLLLSIMMSRNG